MSTSAPTPEPTGTPGNAGPEPQPPADDAVTAASSPSTPEADSGREFLALTGMSGAGRATAARALEDLGWYVVDNLPPALLLPLADLTGEAKQPMNRVAVVVDVRGRAFFTDFRNAIVELAAQGVHARLLFLDASDEVLVRRFESSRRPHPLQGQERILDGIARERELTQELRGRADLVIDTSDINVHQLSSKLHALFALESEAGMRITVMSFGFKYGLPVDADHVVDVRFLPNPFWIPDLRPLNGRDEPVAEYVLDQPGATEFIDRYVAAMEPVVQGYERENRPYVTIAIGCTGGKHRSVAITEALAARLAGLGVTTTAMHRDLGRE